MQFKDICTCKTYTDKEGKEKKTWPKVGVLKTTDAGKQFIELNIFPNQTFFVFEQKTNNTTNSKPTTQENKEPEWLEEDDGPMPPEA